MGWALSASLPGGRTGHTGTIIAVALLHAAALWLFAHEPRPLAEPSRIVYMEGRLLNVEGGHHAAVAVTRTGAAVPVAPPARNRPPILATSPATSPAHSELVPAKRPEPMLAEKTAPPAIAAQAVDSAAAPLNAAGPATAPALAQTDGAGLLSAAPRRLDIDTMRKLARDDERRRVPTPLQRVQDAQRLRASGDTDTARAVAQASRSDCRKASGEKTKANLLLLVPLAYAALTDTGCKW